MDPKASVLPTTPQRLTDQLPVATAPISVNIACGSASDVVNRTRLSFCEPRKELSEFTASLSALTDERVTCDRAMSALATIILRLVGFIAPLPPSLRDVGGRVPHPHPSHSGLPRTIGGSSGSRRRCLS